MILPLTFARMESRHLPTWIIMAYVLFENDSHLYYDAFKARRDRPR